MLKDNIKIIVGEYAEPRDVTAIQIFEDEMLYGVITVNLIDYGMKPRENCVFIHHDVIREIGTDLASSKFDEVTSEVINELALPDGIFNVVNYGYARGIEIELDPEKVAKYREEY